VSQPAPITDLDALAAVDLGSNSFHMLVARSVDGEVVVVDDLKERVALAEGLDEHKFLRLDARERALACLERFGQRIAGIRNDHIRAVGTNTLRQARNGRDFLKQAEAALGHPIEIIAGREEARLVFLGVSHSLGPSTERRLVVDIGGGSTECILGTGFDCELRDSLFMGCVSWSKRYFPDGVLTEERFRKAVIDASLEVRPIERAYQDLGWTSAAGSSGTILAVQAILLANDWSADGITLPALYRLRDALVAQGSVDTLSLEGLKPDRVPVIAGGLAVLIAVFETMRIEKMYATDGALREGLIFDLLGRIAHEDVRDRTIERFMDRYNVDREQASRVAFTAERLLQEAGPGWGLDDYADRLIGWAAALHEIGQTLTYSGYHKHSAYLLENSDMPGFSKDDQLTLAVLVRCHRRKLKPALFRTLPRDRRKRALRLCLLLRLAVLLNRERREDIVPDVHIEVGAKSLALSFPPGWLEANPLSRADLELEAETLDDAGYTLTAG